MSVTPVAHKKSGAFGFWVRNSRLKPPVREWFSYTEYGSKEAAERAARKRDAELEAISPPPNSSHRDVLTKRNRTGKVGVERRVEHDPKNPDNEYVFHVGCWIDDTGKRRTSRWSAGRYGDALARKCAAYARDHQTTDRARILKACAPGERFD